LNPPASLPDSGKSLDAGMLATMLMLLISAALAKMRTDGQDLNTNRLYHNADHLVKRLLDQVPSTRSQSLKFSDGVPISAPRSPPPNGE
jgi:phage portal protein BeeE